GDPVTLPRLAPEDFAGDSWERLINRIGDAVNRRLLAWAETLARELPAARDEFAAARALNHARWALAPIRALAGAPGLPDDVRARLLAMVDGQVASVQQQLDEQVRRLRRTATPPAAVEARLRTIRENSLTAVTRGTHATNAGWSADPTARPRRRVIPD
ncbi:MAG TPA: hypothetical protein VK659_23740, partial [Asanoa sp.]|nr:hypothetical protein [Asanoa sp.]